jgi:hypothetical protein
MHGVTLDLSVCDCTINNSVVYVEAGREACVGFFFCDDRLHSPPFLRLFSAFSPPFLRLFYFSALSPKSAKEGAIVAELPPLFRGILCK